MKISEYFHELESEVKKSYTVAGEARKKGLDPVSEVEIPVATSLAERVVGLVSVLYPQIMDPRIVSRILELEKQYGNLDPAVSLVIAEEIAKEKFCKFKDHLEAVEAGIRVALGYLTLGYVSSPIEGFIQLKIKKTANGEDFLAPYYSGPIRSAGGTEAAFSLVIVDYLREMFGYARYDPTEDEVKRGIHECYEYHERITNLQYLPSEQELDFLMRNLPIQLTGDASEDREVYNYKDLPRVETNFIRSGFCLVIGEGLAQKAPKILKRVLKLKERGFKLSGWDWLSDFTQLQKKLKEGKKSGDSARGGATYMQDLVAGRPVFAHPSESGAFRLRYGRCRTTGYSTLALHPATMAITDDFIAVGTQLKTEKPTKGCTVASCDTIDGPIVKTKDGSVQKIKTVHEARQIYPQVEQIIYLGDILIPYGDFANRNHLLEPPGYVEQYWLEHLKKAGGESELFPSFDEAVNLSIKYSIPLHPSYTYFWREISGENLLSLIDWVSHGTVREGIFIFPYTRIDRERFVKGKRALELIGCEHKVSIENVVLNPTDSKSLLFNLGININDFENDLSRCAEKIKSSSEQKSLALINSLSSIPIKDKSGTFIGARMGRPEKAKLRRLTGSPHCLFPVGDEGGRLRSVQAAVEAGSVKADFPVYSCESCKSESIYPTCERCQNQCIRLVYCKECMKNYVGKCPDHSFVHEYKEQRIDMKHYFDSARKLIHYDNDNLPQVIKGVRGTSSKDHSCEHLAKGILRALHSLNVNKDGTIRYDMTEMPLTHFKPLEIGTSLEKLKKLGYTHDISGNALENESQILELLPHDIILPSCPNTPDEKADDVFLNVSKFIDEELEKIYKLPGFYLAKGREDLVGHMFGCMSPHTSATVVGRLIGFSKVQALLASPYIHAAMRRDCDGDEAAVMLLMDLLLNFSRKFLPSHRGGTQDAPLVLNMRIRASEVDDMIFDLDVSPHIPLSLYEAAEQHKAPGEVKMEQVKERLHTDREFTQLFFAYDTGDLNNAPLCSSYKTLPTMQEKVQQMMELSVRLRPVNVKDVARLVIERHFIRDTRGNLRKFSMQVFRCVGCNEKYRRPPLTGKCTHCGGKLIFTISEGSILKYMQPALDIARNYEVSDYLLESLELNQMYIESIFGKDKEKQENLKKWF
ncbi:DNA polymerase II large subunit [Candidatus Pacearchaeota archaeon]|nr:DNA polymerase II large subunit [Candidatus Pacearchaeota archaeon]